MPDMRQVTSSTVDSIGYDPLTQELHVTWNKSLKTSVYEGVPPEVAEETMNSWSVGQAVHQNIKNHYPHKYA